MNRRLISITTASFLVAVFAAAASTATPVFADDMTEGFERSVNTERAKTGRAPLTRDDRLDAIAASHAKDMAAQGYFSHRAPDGSELDDRAARAGYRACLMAENIAKGHRNTEEVIAGWMKSAGHRRNILLRKVMVFGAARAEGDIWVLVLAAPGC